MPVRPLTAAPDPAIATWPEPVRPVHPAAAPAVPGPVLRPGRSLHVVDVENINRGPAADYQPVAALWNDVVRPAPGDLVVCASDITGVFAVHAAFPSARQLTGRGPDGADRALGEVLSEPHLTDRFDTIILGSGDGYFAAHLRRLRQHGLHTVVVSRLGHTSAVLRGSAHRVFELP